MHADKVVGVHDSVNEAIKDNGEVDISIIIDMGVEPIKEKDGNVVVDVKEGKLPPLFANHNKDGIPEIPHLGNVEEPEEIGESRMLLVVPNARKHRVVIAVGQEYGFNCHVGAQHNL